MSLLDRLYAIDAGDQSQRATWVADNQSSAAVSITISTDWINPTALPLLLLNWGADLAPGAAQFPYTYRFNVMDPGSTTILQQFDGGQFNPAGIAAATVYVGNHGQVIVPGKHRVRCTCRFNAGANSNSVGLYVGGFLIPRGTLGIS